MRVGILGGGFNPPHIGHLICAQEALARLDLERVVLVPAGEAPHREIEQDPGPDARARMCELATTGDDRLEASRLEVGRAGPSYTVETLRALRESAPENELVLILGGDQAAALSSWREPGEVLRLATVAVAERGEARRDEISKGLLGLSDADRVSFFDMPRIDVSSTLVRRRAAAGESIRYLVPDAVADFIAAEGLYRASTPVGAE